MAAIALHYPVSKTPYILVSMTYTLDRATGVAVAAYNTPQNLHALTHTQRVETFFVLEHAKLDEDVRALLWTGTGTRAFGAGADLKDFGVSKLVLPDGVEEAYAERNLWPDNTFTLANQVRAFWDFPKPLVIAVNGMAVGGAANIALMNFGDLVVCSTNAKFMYPFAKLGFTPELGSSLVMPYVVGLVRTKEMMMLGDWFSADKALEWGLVNAVVAPEELMAHALDLARRLAENHPENMRLMKAAINGPLRQQLDAALVAESAAVQESMMLAMPTLIAKRRKQMKKKRASEADGKGGAGRSKL